jgi:hypothetical protein
VRVWPSPNDRSFPDYRIRDIDADGVWLDVPGPPAVVVPLERVHFISTYDRAGGAQRGAVIGGIAGVVIVGVLAALIARQSEIAARDGGGGPSSAGFVVGASVGGGIVGALLGAGFGAMRGYEDRYVVAR